MSEKNDGVGSDATSENNQPDNSTESTESTGRRLAEAISGLPAGTQVLNVPEVAEVLDVLVTRVMDDLNSHRLVAVQVDGVRQVPARFFTDGGEINRFVPGLVALLADGGYSDAEILEFLFTEDESLPGRPVDALHGHLAREVMRRAQAMAIA